MKQKQKRKKANLQWLPAGLQFATPTCAWLNSPASTNPSQEYRRAWRHTLALLGAILWRAKCLDATANSFLAASRFVAHDIDEMCEACLTASIMVLSKLGEPRAFLLSIRAATVQFCHGPLTLTHIRNHKPKSDISPAIDLSLLEIWPCHPKSVSTCVNPYIEPSTLFSSTRFSLARCPGTRPR